MNAASLGVFELEQEERLLEVKRAKEEDSDSDCSVATVILEPSKGTLARSASLTAPNRKRKSGRKITRAVSLPTAAHTAVRSVGGGRDRGGRAAQARSADRNCKALMGDQPCEEPYDGGDRNNKEVTGGAKSEKFRGVKGSQGSGGTSCDCS